MRFGALGFALIVATMAAGCGYATSPTPVAAFALDAGNYTLKVACSGGFVTSGPQEGQAPVTVTRSGTVWTVRSLQVTDTFAMSLTTDGAATDSARGDVAGTVSGSGGTVTANGTISATNSGANAAGGPITSVTGSSSSLASFNQVSGSGSCATAATWTLTPR